LLYAAVIALTLATAVRALVIDAVVWLAAQAVAVGVVLAEHALFQVA
jgi:hypothetical protein